MAHPKFDHAKSLPLAGFTSASSIRNYALSLRTRADRSRKLAGMTYDPEIADELESYARELESEADKLESDAHRLRA